MHEGTIRSDRRGYTATAYLDGIECESKLFTLKATHAGYSNAVRRSYLQAEKWLRTRYSVNQLVKD